MGARATIVGARATIVGALALAAGALVLAPPGPARAQLVADHSKHLVAISTGFTGTDVLLFGAIEGEADVESDVVVVLRGPNTIETVRRQERIGGVWINVESVTFKFVPSYYAVASSRPIDEVVSESYRARNRIGIQNLGIKAFNIGDPSQLAVFERALYRNKQRQGLYPDQIGRVSFLGRTLFRTRVRFPANVPTGTYLVEVYRVQQGRIVGAQTTPLVVGKIGIGAEVFDFAHNQPAMYGIVAIVLAVFAGWLAGVIFRKA